MSYDFSGIYDRHSAGSVKWDIPALKNTSPECAYPFSVAEMEFKSPPAVIEAIQTLAQGGFFTYSYADEIYLSAVISFMKRRHSWETKKEWITLTPSVVFALKTAVRAFTNPGDGVILQRPVYGPFSGTVTCDGRVPANNPLVRDGNTYRIDFDNLEHLARQPKNKLMLLCSPHNPVGRVWTREELQKVGQICRKNGVVLVSDEIHFDVTKDRHTVLSTADETLRENTIVCTSASKTFNLTGLPTGNIIIEDETLRKRFQKQLGQDWHGDLNCCARAAIIAAYTHCDTWIDQMNRTVNRNFDLIASFLAIEVPRAVLFQREGTYLAWLDLSFLGFDDRQLHHFLMDECGLVPNPGTSFGSEGSGFARLTLAAPESALITALERFSGKLKTLL